MQVDDIADMQDEIADQMAEIEERQNFFAEAAQDGKEDLMDELNELEALALEDEMDEIAVPTGGITAPA